MADYKSVANHVKQSDLCRQGCWSHGWTLAALQRTYFRGVDLKELPDTRPLPLPQRPLLLFHRGSSDLTALRSRQPGLQCWEAPGSMFSSFLLLPEKQLASSRQSGDRLPDPSRFGLRRCSPPPP